MKLLVEISQGLGNCVQATPLMHALWLLGHELDLYINSPMADKLKPLWQGWPVVNRMFAHHDQFKAADYDFGVSAYGRRRLVRMFPPGMCLKVEKRHVKHQSETEANVEVARWLGYAGPTPAAWVNAHDANLELPPEQRHKRTAPTGGVVVHPGCDPVNAVKRWPHWRELCERLKAAGRDVIVVGTHADRSEENWEDDFISRFHMELPELAALLKRSAFYLGNDSGVGHLAAAVGVPGLMLYGPSNPVKNAPNSRVMRQLVAPALEGEGRDVNAPRPVDMARLGMEQVWSEVEALFADPARDPQRTLPARLTDGVEPRWQQYVAMTYAQPAPQATEHANLPPDFTPKISVVIPTYNRGANALRAVRSALNQTEKSVEVLVIDDGSGDETPQHFANLPPRVRYFRKDNGGASSARNVGLRHARGEWIALLDSDDEWAPDKLERQLVAMGTAYVAGASRHVHINVNGSRQDKPEVLPGADQHLFRDLYEDLSLKTSSLLFKRHLLERTGLFNERFPISNDWDFFLRLARVVNNSGFVCLPEPLVIVHRSGDSLSKVQRANALEEALTRICMLNALLHADDAAAITRHIQRAGRKHLELARALRKQGEKDKAREHAKEAMRAGLKLKGLWKLIQAM